MGKELARIGAPFGQPEWSALALMEDPESVVRAHWNFVEAGASVITTNAYAVVPFHLGEGLFAERGWELAELAGRLARQVADEAGLAGRSVSVAGSLPPVFGSYEPHRFDPAIAPDLLAVLIAAQADAVDFWIGETIGSLAEAEAIVAALVASRDDRPRWLAFSLAEEWGPDGPTLWSGESVEDAGRLAAELGAEAVLLNCATPEAISAALPRLVEGVAGGPDAIAIGVYANAFPPREDGYSANGVILDRREELTGERYSEMARRWVEQGATIIGGCCGMHPEHIASLADHLGPRVPSSASADR